MTDDTRAQAQNLLFHKVYAPSFLNKCASLGVTFGSPEEAMLAIETVALMKQANETVAAVQETKQSSLVKKANAMLRAALTSSEPAPQVEVSPDVSTAIKALIS